MRIALPLFNGDVSPRFCRASEVLVVVFVDDHEVSRSSLLLGNQTFPERLEALASLGVTHVLCGGFNRRYLDQAEELGMQVISGLWGDSEKILIAFLNNGLAHTRPEQSWGHCHPGGRCDEGAT